MNQLRLQDPVKAAELEYLLQNTEKELELELD